MNIKYRRSAYTLLAGYAIWGVFWGAWSALLPAVKSVSGASDAVFGLSLLAIAVGALPTMFFVGPIIDRVGSKALVISYLLFGVSIALLGFAVTPLSLFVLLLFVGATSGALDVALNSGVAAFESASKGRFFNSAHAAFPVAVVVSSPLAGLMRELHVGLPTIFIVIAFIVCLMGLANIGAHKDSWLVVKKVVEKAKTSSIYFTKIIILFGLIAAIIHIVENAVEQWSAIYLEHNLLTTAFIASLGPAIYMGMLFVGRLFMQKYGRNFSDYKIIIITAISAVVGMFFAAFSFMPLIALFGFAVAGFGMASGIPTIFSVTGKSVPEDCRARAISSVTILAYFGYLISPPAVGWIAGMTSLRFAWIALALLALLLIYFAKLTLKKDKCKTEI